MTFYTLEDAEEILPELERIVRETRRIHRKITRISDNAHEEIELEDEEGNLCLRYSFVEGTPEVERLIDRVNAKLALIERLGVHLRDLDKGEIEFPSLFQGRRIVYHWRIGMKAIRYWYSEEDDYAKKKSIVDLTKKEETI